MKARAKATNGSESLEAQFELLRSKNQALARSLQRIVESHAILADEYDYAPVGFLTLDEKGCIRQMNVTAARMLGRDRSQLLTKPFFTHVAKGSCSAFFRHLRECRRTPVEQICELALRTREGQVVPIEMRSVPVPDIHRGDTVYRTAITNITERRRATEALAESERRYRDVVDLVESLSEAIFIVVDGFITVANHAAARLCRVETTADLVNSEFLKWVSPGLRRELISILLHASVASKASTVEGRMAKGRGKGVEVELTAHPYLFQQAAGVLVSVRDISQRRLAERQVLVASEHERARIGRDLHDSLCQNLMGAACVAKTLVYELQGANTAPAEKAQQIATLITKSVEEARNLARGLSPVTTETPGLVAALSDMVEQVTRTTGVQCVLRCRESLTIENVTVSTNLYRIAQEAINNAVKHANAKSVIVELAAGNGQNHLSVKDDGKGMRTSEARHHGMGMYTMRYRAAAIGGSLEVRRNSPRGTIVTCAFSGGGAENIRGEEERGGSLARSRDESQEKGAANMTRSNRPQF